MNDGNTTALSPVSEDADMNAIRSIFERVANTIVQASELAREVGQLRQTVQDVQKQADDLRKANAWFEEQTASLRKQRDEANAELDQVHNDLIQMNIERDAAVKKVESLEASLTRALDANDGLRKGRDDAEYKAMELEDKLKASQSKLARFLDLAKPDEPAPSPVQPRPEAQASSAYPDPKPVMGTSQDFGKPYDWNPSANAQD